MGKHAYLIMAHTDLNMLNKLINVIVPDIHNEYQFFCFDGVPAFFGD